MIKKLQKKFNLEVETPFSLKFQGKTHTFQCLIRGYGATNGMIIDENWSLIEPIANDIVSIGYGFSYFDIKETSIEGFQEVLDDWGKIDS